MAPPVYEEYRKVFEKHKELYGQNFCVFYQVGSFFELYDILNKQTGETWCNVKEVIDILGLQLSIKSDPSDPQLEQLFAGFPDYTLHRWASKLTQQGWTVAVVEQRKDARGRVEQREVTRILSPGTHSEQASAGEAPFVASIWLQEQPAPQTPKYGISVVDLTTGATHSYEGQTRGKHNVWSADEGLHFFQVYNPREVVALWRGDCLTQPSEGSIRRIFGISKQQIHFRQALPAQQGSLENVTVREEFLRKHFNIRSLLPVREYLYISKLQLIERSLCCLLRFLEDHFASGFSALQEHTVWNPQSQLECGNNALAQLNFVAENSQDSVLGIFNKAITPMGKRAIRRRLLTPLTRRADIEARLERVESFMSLETQSTVEKSLTFMFDMPRLHRKVMNFTLSGGDLLGLYQTYKEIGVLAKKVDPKLFSCPSAESIQKILATWEKYFSKEKAEQASENISFIRTGISEKIDSCEGKIAEIYKEVQNWLAPFNQTEFRIEEKDKVPISVRGTKAVIFAASKMPVPKTKEYENIEFKQTKTVGHSIEAPFLERANERLLGLRSRLSEAIQDVLPNICIEFYNSCGSTWTSFEEFVEEVDCSLCFAKVAQERGFYRPTLIETTESGSSIRVKKLRHPLIEAIATKTQYVTHDVSLVPDGGGWLLYGMNASGKSSLMKAIGIAVLLAQCGSFVPAREMELAPFERLLTRILNVDNLWAGLSSFAVEVSELRDIFLRADNKTLVLGDELCSGTESVSATALVAAGIQHLLKVKSRFVFATHYHDLFKLPEIRDAKGLSVWHLKVRYDVAQDILIYERTLSPGPGSTLYGIEVARALGMPVDVLDAAITFRRALQGEKVEEDINPSAWNRSIAARECEMCGASIARDLEVHHIRPRADAEGADRFDDTGLGRDDLRNLAVVCGSCHDAHHIGRQEISPVLQTSKGPNRSPPLIKQITPVREKLSSEQMKIIQKIVRDYPNLTVKMLRYKLSNDEDIHVTEGILKKVKAERDLQQD